MPQIILKERTAHLASYTFLQEMLINIKTRHFHSSINQEYLFHITLITSYLRHVNIAKFLRTAVLYNSQKQPLEEFYEKRCCLEFHKIHRKVPVPEPHFQQSCGSQACNFFKKRLWHKSFPVNFVKFLGTPFLQNNSGRLLLTSRSSRLQIFFKIVFLRLFLKNLQAEGSQLY